MAIALVLLIVIIFFTSLSSITRHNQTIQVPSVTGKSLAEAMQILTGHGFNTEIKDSVYIDSIGPLTVTRQSPESDLNVKVNRTIYLTINRAVPPMIEMPDLRGFSYKSAEMYLITIGLKMGDTSFVPDIAKNAVKEQRYNGKLIAPGSKIRMASVIDLVLGSGVGSESFNVPDLLGMTVNEARSYLNSQNIGISAILIADFIKDTSSAFIVKQNPEPELVIATGEKIKNKISPGQLMDIWISVNPPAIDSTEDSNEQQFF